MPTVALPEPFIGAREQLPFTHATYEIIGTPGKPTVVVLGGISATKHVAANATDPTPGWWEAQVGSGRAVDTNEFTVIGFDYLGADLEPGARVPLVDTYDQARALAAVLDDAGIDHLTAFIGSSYGGMVALAFGALFPERVEKLVVIGAAHQPHPMATAIRSVQRKIVLQAARHGTALAGLELARQLAMTTYRTAEEFADRFASEQQVDDYLEHCGRRYAEQYSAERFLCLSRSIDLHGVDPQKISVPTTLVAIEGDAIAPPWQVRALASELGNRANLIELKSVYGHDAFLKEIDAISEILQQQFELEIYT